MVAFWGVADFFCACLTISFAQLCGCFAARKEEIRQHCSELGDPQTRTIKHNGRVRNHSRPGSVVSLDLAVLGGQAQNGGEVLLYLVTGADSMCLRHFFASRTRM